MAEVSVHPHRECHAVGRAVIEREMWASSSGMALRWSECIFLRTAEDP